MFSQVIEGVKSYPTKKPMRFKLEAWALNEGKDFAWICCNLTPS
jgi:hypothetical protein